MAERILILFFSLLSISWPFLLIYAVIRLIRRKHVKKETVKPHLLVDSALTTHISGASLMIIVFLLLALMAISQRILYDLARHFSEDGKFDYFDNLQTIATHAAFIIPVFIISILVMIGLKQKLEKYAVVLVPYFFTSILLTLQLLIQISVYFYNHHTKFQYYIVVPVIIAITSAAIYYIQNLYQKKLDEMRLGKDEQIL